MNRTRSRPPAKGRAYARRLSGALCGVGTPTHGAVAVISTQHTSSDSVVKFGFCRRLEPVNYVNQTLERFEHLQTVRRGIDTAMWKYILAFTFLLIGIVEIVLAFSSGLREALMKTSPVRFKQGESSAFLFAGISALVMGLGILFFGLFWT